MITCPWCGTSYYTFQSSCSKCGGPLPAQQDQDGKPSRSFAPPPPAPRSFHEEYARRLVNEDPEASEGITTAVIGGFLAASIMILPITMVLHKLDLFGVPGWLIFAFALVALLFLLFSLWLLIGGIVIVRERDRELQKMVDVMRTGQAAVGEIVDVRENQFKSIGERHPWEIHYKFKLDNGKRVYGKVITMNNPSGRLRPGCEVNVLYLPNEPTRCVLYPHP